MSEVHLKGVATKAEATSAGAGKVTVTVLAAMVMGSMVGAGIFTLPQRFGVAGGVLGGLTAWVVAGVGFLLLALVFQELAIRKPNLDAGIFAYAKAGFGDYVGFNSAFGYWASAAAGNAFYWVFIFTTVGRAFPAFGKGNTILAVAASSVCVWLFAWLVAQGVKQATVINRVLTVVKIVPILIFIAVVGVAAIGVYSGQFQLNFWGYEQPSLATLFSQARATMLAITFTFLGIEGAVVYSRFAKRREDVGRATVMGFLAVLAIFALVTMVSYGVVPRQHLAAIGQPSVATVFEFVVGRWGSVFMSLGLILSVLGAYLAWTLMAAEILFIPATDKDMPGFLRRENSAGTPIAALILTSAMVQLYLIVTLLSEDALNFMLDLTAALSLIPYLLSAAYALKLAVTRESYDPGRSLVGPFALALLATIFTLFLLYAAGVKFILFASIIAAVGTFLYVWARRENSLRVFRPFELVLCALIVVVAVVGVVSLATGAITI